MKVRRRTHMAALAAWVFSFVIVCERQSAAQETGGDEATADAAAARVILKEATYWRVYAVRGGQLRLNPAVIRDKKECEKLQFTDRWMKSLEHSTKALWEGQRIDWSKTDWRDKAAAFYDIKGFDPFVPTLFTLQDQAPPPKDWMKPEFDDSAWMTVWNAREKPAHPGKGTLYNRDLYYRAPFQAPDPAKVKDLKLKVVHRGGLRVFVNGTEVARSYLPQGELGPDVAGDPYPVEAYIADREELAPDAKASIAIADLPVSFLKGERSGDPRYTNYRAPQMGFGHNEDWLSRDAWTRIVKLRDRELATTIPANMLRKGENILALEIRGSAYHPVIVDKWCINMTTDTTWPHAQMIKLELKDQSGSLPPAMEPGQGLQVWVEDMHTRVYSTDYRPAPMSGGAVRVAGALNGTFSGMVVVWSKKEINGLKAEISDLSPASGSSSFVIPRSAFSISGMVGHPLTEMTKIGMNRGTEKGPLVAVSQSAILHAMQSPYAPKPDKSEKGAVVKDGEKILFYDHIGPVLPGKVPATTAQPLWLSLRIPQETAPGLYKGALRIEAAETEAVTIPVEVEVIGWRVPNPSEFQTDVTLEHHSYAIANHYLLPPKTKVKPESPEWQGPVAANVPLWSDEHFRLMEAGFKQLARVGNDMVHVPVIQRTEFGNWQDSIIKWIRKKDGSITFDFTNLDKYLDLAVKHLGKPRIICFDIMQYCINAPRATVPLCDEATGKTENFGVSCEDEAFTRLSMWQGFAAALIQHLRTKGLDKSVYWGHAGDLEADPGLMNYLWQVFPGHYWAAGGHTFSGGAGGGGHSRNVVRYFAGIYMGIKGVNSAKGWKREDDTYMYVYCPREMVDGLQMPVRWRALPGLALHMGYSGVGRMGFDSYDYNWYSGSWALDWAFPGRPCHMLSWPGKDGAEPSARFETLIEGIQETEARSFLEQVIDRGLVSADVAAEINQALHFHLTQAFNIPSFRGDDAVDYIYQWQDGSRRLYKMAARIAETVGVDVNRIAFANRVAALGKTRQALRLRNWTAQSRAWKAESSVPWLVPAATEGNVMGFQELAFDIDGKNLKPGAKMTGAITVTDVASAKKSAVTVNAAVGQPVELLYDHPHFNVRTGQSETREFRVVNNAVTEQDWKLASPASWIKVEPGAGRLAPGNEIFVKLTASPADKEAKVHENTFAFQAAGGMVNTQFVSKTFVIPLFKEKDDRAMPLGRIVKIDDMDPKRVKNHVLCAKGTVIETGDVKERGRSMKQSFGTPSGGGDGHHLKQYILLMGKERFSRGMWVYPHHETVYNLEGSKITAFSAYVGVTQDARQFTIRFHHRRVNFEIWVDGKPVVQSGLMRITDPPRYLTIEGLDGAKELKLVTRLDSDMDDNTFLATWGDANFYEKFDKKDEATGAVVKAGGTGIEKTEDTK